MVHLTMEGVTYWVLGVLYLMLVAYCVRHYIRVWTLKHQTRSGVGKKSWAPFFYPMLMVGCFIRGGYMLTRAGDFIKPLDIVVLLNTIPTLILFSAYMIVLLSWAQLYHASDKAIVLRSIYFVTNLVFYGAYIIMQIYSLGVYSNDDMNDTESPYHMALWYTCSSMYFVVSLAFLVYALLLVKFLRVALFATKFDTIKQINYFTFLVVLVSLVVEAVGKLPSEGGWWVFEPVSTNFKVYFALLEVVPLIIMIQVSIKFDFRHHSPTFSSLFSLSSPHPLPLSAPLFASPFTLFAVFIPFCLYLLDTRYIFQMHKTKQSQTDIYSPLLTSSPSAPLLGIPKLPSPHLPTPDSPFMFSTTPTRPPTSYYI